ncbi:extracellular solute-binding protein [Paenibacillus contaminans]|uniref:ABC transporter substrate-binding protein n=1 Tax=Paenibacillus contaminans TaxID=450362 RepID=A0A329LZP9_9BACL|nr:extracellular solute-binding protein [Paenibacillus contaminans]RAV13339.1 hypothetical protein DQG23_33580 [Paenibacillus contaminans]
MKKRSMILALTAVALVAVGCTKQADTPPSAKPGEASPGAGTAKPEAKMKLNWFVDGDQGSLLPKDAKDDFVKRTIEEKFNVELTVQSYPMGADYDNKVSLALASGDVPDMFVGTGIFSQKLAKDGLLAVMTPYVSPQTMPNYYKYWMTDEVEMRTFQIENDFYRAPLPYNKKSSLAYYIRKDWLDKFGLPVPTSYDQMMEAMKKFTTGDPDGNGKPDTYGYSTSGSGTSFPRDFPQFRNNGLYTYYFVSNGKFIDVATDPGVGKVADEVLQMIDEGLVDPDWFLNKAPQVIDKAVQGKVGIVYSALPNFAMESDPNSVQAKTKGLNPKADWVPFNPFPGKPFYTENEAGNSFLFSTKTAKDNPEKIKKTVEILDWLAGEEGFLLTQLGLKDKHYTMNGKTINWNKEQFKKDVVQNGNFLTIYDFFSPNAPEKFGFTVNDPDLTPRDAEIQAYLKSNFIYAPPVGASTTPPAGTNLGEMRGKMNEYHVKMLFEDKSGTNWPKYREELMTKYKAKEIFEAYAKQISDATGKPVEFVSSN